MTKLVINMSADEAAKIAVLPPKTALISISNNGGNFAPLQVSGEDIIQLRFDDIRGSEAVQHNKEWFRPISLNQAHEIINFINERADYNFYVHCSAGISRSGAIAMYLHVVYGHQLKPNFYFTSDPNPYVLGLLISEYYRKFNA